jgi:chaperone BCS1
MKKLNDNDSLLLSIKDLGKNNILLIEDIDSLFEKRVATDDNPSITFSNLINVLDGFLYKEGAIIFMTTNHPEKLDHALLRIGRIDMIFEINYPNKIHIKKLFFDLLETKNEEQFNKFYENIKNKKISMSSIINFIFRYTDKWHQHTDELLKTDNFIKNVLNENKSNEFYT